VEYHQSVGGKTSRKRLKKQTSRHIRSDMPSAAMARREKRLCDRGGVNMGSATRLLDKDNLERP